MVKECPPSISCNGHLTRGQNDNHTCTGGSTTLMVKICYITKMRKYKIYATFIADVQNKFEN